MVRYVWLYQPWPLAALCPVKFSAVDDQASNTFNEFAVKSKDSLGTMNDMNEGINNISIAIEESAKGYR